MRTEMKAFAACCLALTLSFFNLNTFAQSPGTVSSPEFWGSIRSMEDDG
jgi:hypothetical protein